MVLLGLCAISCVVVLSAARDRHAMDLTPTDVSLTVLTVALEQRVLKLETQKDDLMKALEFVLRNPTLLHAFINAQETLERMKEDGTHATG